MKQNIDDILKQALTPADEPQFWLNQKILNQAKETKGMEKRNYKKIVAAVLSAALVLGVGSVGAYAAWQYLAPETVAENMQETKLIDAFQGEDAILVNETQSYGGYDVTLLGVVSGENLSQFEMVSNGHISHDKTYAVVAIKNSDGTPMPETSEDAYGELSFFASPLIKDYDPNWYNAITMHGGYQDLTIDGILYRLAECDNVEMFADHGLYFCVMDSTFYNKNAYDYNETTGEITRNESYEGLNALFNLPIDESKADPEAAAEYLTSLELEMEEEVEIEETDVDKWMKELTPENIDKKAERVESTVQVLSPDENGLISYEYEIDGRGGAESTCLVIGLFEDGEFGMSSQFPYHYSDGNMDSLAIETFTRNEDGTITFAVYIPK